MADQPAVGGPPAPLKEMLGGAEPGALLRSSSLVPGPAAWPAALGAALVLLWATEFSYLPAWAALPFALAYPLFVRTAEHRRCGELRGGLDGGLQFALGVAAALAWVIIPAQLSVYFFGADVSVYHNVFFRDVLNLCVTAAVFMPFLFGLVFRYAELRIGSRWAVALVVVLYAALCIYGAESITLIGVAWCLLTAAVYALSYLLTRRLWLPIGLRIGEALLVTSGPIFTLGIVRVHPFAHRDSVELLYLAILAVAVVVLSAVAQLRGAFVRPSQAWTAQTGLQEPPAFGADHGPLAAADAGLWAALGCALLVLTLYECGPQPAVWALAAVLVYWAFVRLVERRRAGGMRSRLCALGEGAVGLVWGLSTGLVGSQAMVQLASGVQPVLAPLGAAAVSTTVLFALCEEIIWRGLLLRHLQPRIGSGLALTATAVGFAAWHQTLNPPYFIHLAAAGALYGAAYLCTRRLWLPVGMHTGWNLAVGLSAVAGVTYTPLAWLVVLVIEILATVVLLLIARRRGRLVRAPWKTRRRAALHTVAAPPGVPAPQVPSNET